MLNRLIKQLVYAVLVFILLSMFIFALARIVPGDPVKLALGPYATDEMADKLREELHLSDPLYMQYYIFMRNLIIDGKLGLSMLNRRDVMDDMIEYAPATIELVLASSVMIILISIPLGVSAALHKDTLIDHIARVVAFAGVSFPRFFNGIMLQLLFGVALGILPFIGRIGNDIIPPDRITGLFLLDSLLVGDFRAFRSSLSHILLPSFTLALAIIAQLTRLLRANMIEEGRKDYAKVFHVLGLPQILNVYKYRMKNAISSSLTVFGLSIGWMLGNCFIVETVFAWPGIARYGVNAMLNGDYNGIVGVTLFAAAGVLIANTAVEILYMYLDPRTRLLR